MKTNLETLLNANYCFAVVISVIRSKIKSLDWQSKEYFMVFSKKVEPKLKKLKIHTRKCTEYDYLCEVDMSDEDVNFFKMNQDKFTKVIDNSEGRIYELKRRPFKDMITKQTALK